MTNDCCRFCASRVGDRRRGYNIFNVSRKLMHDAGFRVKTRSSGEELLHAGKKSSRAAYLISLI